MLRMKNNAIILFVIISLFLLALITVPRDLLEATDVPDYSDTAKFFAGEYKAKYRSSHSIMYGLMLSPYVKLTESFFILKFASVFWLSLLILSIYYISNKDKRTLILFITAPFIWYMSPWLSPVPIVSLLFLWTYHFIAKFEKEEKIKYIIYAGVLAGLASVFWDAALYFSIIFLISFLYNKKFFFSWIFLLALLIGLLPRLIVNQVLFNFAFFEILKNFLALSSFLFEGGIYEQGYSSPSLVPFLIVFTFIPFYFYSFYKKTSLIKYKKTMIFLTLSILFILLNPQIRVLLPIIPIIILILGRELNAKRYKRQLIIFSILSLLVILPYLVQAKYETNNRNFEVAIQEFPNFELKYPTTKELIKSDLDEIAKEYPDQIFVVGNINDAYIKLAHVYWGDDIKEFISMEDYNLFLNNQETIAKKEIRTDAKINARRELRIIIDWRKNSKDKTDYDSIRYAISIDKELGLENFRFVKKYKTLYLFEKVYPSA